MRQSFPKHKRNIVVSKARNVFEILVELNNYENLIMVVGSDRVKEFDMLIKKYNGVASRHGFYEFKNVEVLSAGERDPDAEGVEGMSASKMRAAAENSDFDSFKQGTPLNDTQAKKLYFDVRKSMGIKEELDLSDFEVVRDLYLSEQIWNVGDLVITNEGCGEIIRRGTNYVTIVKENYKVEKVWLHDILIDENQKVKQDKDIKDRKGYTTSLNIMEVRLQNLLNKKEQLSLRNRLKWMMMIKIHINLTQVITTGKTKPSKHTKKFKQMFGDETNPRIPRKKGQYWK